MSTPQANMSKLCPKCQYFVGAPLLSSTVLILLYMEFTRAAQVVVAAAARQLSSRRCVWGGCYVGKQFLKGGHHLLLQNVTVHVGIHVSLNELQLRSTSSSHAAPDHDATTTMLDCRQSTIFLVLLTRASPHVLDTI